MTLIEKALIDKGLRFLVVVGYYKEGKGFKASIDWVMLPDQSHRNLESRWLSKEDTLSYWIDEFFWGMQRQHGVDFQVFAEFVKFGIFKRYEDAVNFRDSFFTNSATLATCTTCKYFNASSPLLCAVQPYKVSRQHTLVECSDYES